MPRSTFSLRSLCFLSVALMTLGAASEPPTIRQIQPRANTLTLFWNGGSPPFRVQMSSDLLSWDAVGQTDGRLYALNRPENPAVFFRVESAATVDLGPRIGEWRIAEGEFGDPLAKHRLKSIWEFHLSEETTTATAAQFFQEAGVRIRYLNGVEVATFTGRLSDLPDASWKTEDREMELTWSWGEGEWQRDLRLTLKFPYSVNGFRFQPVNLSDPTVTLEATYASSKPKVSHGQVSSIRKESATLVEVDDSGAAPQWWNRRIHFTHNGITIDSRYRIGVPLIQGGPAFIFKTPLLVSWEGTTVTGLTEAPLTFHSRFSQTYFPFHHNFVETLWLEPALEPDIEASVLEELKERNIRFIVPQDPSAFPNEKPTLSVFGFDDTLRSL